MRFKVIPYRGQLPPSANNLVVLLTDGWDDWFKFSTMYNVFYHDEGGVQHRIGEVKIGEFNMAPDQRTPRILNEFDDIGDAFFSLGQDDSYYQSLNDLGDSFRDTYLAAMRDVARNADLFDRALKENVTGVSLLRSVSDKSVRGQFRRMAEGGARLTAFSFAYTPPPWARNSQPPTFDFKVVPGSSPPTNVHVLIGRNGVGKTHTVNQMTNALVRSDGGVYGNFVWQESAGNLAEPEAFSNIISVTFSAFDSFEPLPTRENKLSAVRYQYVGLKHLGKDGDGNPKPPKSPDDLAADFGQSVQVIVTQVAKGERWKGALKLLESDRIFRHAEVWSLIDEYKSLLEIRETRIALQELRKSARNLYSKLSSGHKIVLLTITRVVETLEERSLVLVDEPEAHLHPPLLSALIRALSDLLIDSDSFSCYPSGSAENMRLANSPDRPTKQDRASEV